MTSLLFIAQVLDSQVLLVYDTLQRENGLVRAFGKPTVLLDLEPQILVLAFCFVVRRLLASGEASQAVALDASEDGVVVE